MTNWPKTICIDQSMAHYCTNSIRGEREYTDSDLAEKLAQALEGVIEAYKEHSIRTGMLVHGMPIDEARQALADYRGE